MTKRPENEQDFVTLEDLDKRVKQPAWRWWLQPFGLGILLFLVMAVVVVWQINKPGVIAKREVTLERAVSDGDLVFFYGGQSIPLGRVSMSENPEDFEAGDVLCLELSRGALDAAPRFRLSSVGRC